MIHRDIKPENILLFKTGAKLADFGSSTQHCPESGEQLCGTAEYLAPEVIEQQRYDEKIDIWSVGVLVYEMLLGRTPFAQMIQTNKFQDQHELVRAISDAVRVALSEAERQDRIPGLAAAFRQRLHPALSPARPDEKTQCDPGPRPRVRPAVPGRRHSH